MSFEHPSNQAIDIYLAIQHKKNNPMRFSKYVPESLIYTAYYFALFASFFINVNPYGRASRISYEKTLNPVWRHGRKLLPFGLIIGGVMFTDSHFGIY